MDRPSFFDMCSAMVQDHGDTLIAVLRRVYGTSFARGFDQHAYLRDIPPNALSMQLSLLKDYASGALAVRIGIANDLLRPQLASRAPVPANKYRIAV